jgi:hypothetical protein
MMGIISYRCNGSHQLFRGFPHGQFHGLDNGCKDQCSFADFHSTIRYVGKISTTRLNSLNRTNLLNTHNNIVYFA